MTKYGFFNQKGTVILVCVVHSWNYNTHSRKGVSHFMIADDLKNNIMSTKTFIQDLLKYYNDRLLAWFNNLCVFYPSSLPTVRTSLNVTTTTFLFK